VPRKNNPPEQGSSGQSGPLLERDGLISSEELAVFLGESLGTLDAWASRGGGPPFHKVGRHRKYWPADVKDWLRENRHEDRQEPAA
jgi:Helix-turn-helix domain